MGGAEFRGRVHEESFVVLGPKFKPLFCSDFGRRETDFGFTRARHNYEGREFDSRTRLVVGRAAVGSEFRRRVHEGSFGVLGPKFKRVFLVGVSGDGNEFGVGRNYEGREFDSRTRLVVGRAAVGSEFRGRVHEGSFGVLGPKFKRVFLVGVSGDGNEFGVGRNDQPCRVRSAKALVVKGWAEWLGRVPRGVSGFLSRSSSGFSWASFMRMISLIVICPCLASHLILPAEGEPHRDALKRKKFFCWEAGSITWSP